MITKNKIISILKEKYFQSKQWEEIADEILALDKEIKPDYEILSFKQDSGMTDLWTYFDNQGWARNNNGRMETKPYKTLDDIINNHLDGGVKYNINSVKRLSNGEIFTIGDNIQYCKNQYKIIKFDISNTNTSNKIVVTVDWKQYQYELQSIQHVKSSLFTTEDGVDIYEGMEVFLVHPTTLNTIVGLGTIEYFSYKGWLFFSTKEAAELFILENKPCLSYNDVKSYIENNNFYSATGLKYSELLYNKFKILQELVKSKVK
jgi:hypothetical protein